MQCNINKVIMPATPRVHSNVSPMEIYIYCLGASHNKTGRELAKSSLCEDFFFFFTKTGISMKCTGRESLKPF